MTWEEKFAALNALSECSLKMRRPGDWYVSQHVETKQEGSPILEGAYGNGATPEAAIIAHWESVAMLPPMKYVVLNAMDSAKRRHVRWNGYMWEDSPWAPKTATDGAALPEDRT